MPERTPAKPTARRASRRTRRVYRESGLANWREPNNSSPCRYDPGPKPESMFQMPMDATTTAGLRVPLAAAPNDDIRAPDQRRIPAMLFRLENLSSFRGRPRCLRTEPGIGPVFTRFAKPIDSRHPWRSRYAPPLAFAFAIPANAVGFACDGAAGAPE